MAKRSTTNADAYELLLRGKEHFRQGELRLAKEMFERALSLDPNFADAQAWLGLALYTQFADGQADRTILDAAIARVNQALAIDPNLIVARRALVHIYHSTGQTEEGLKQAKWALDASPDDFDAQEAAALAYFRAGMIDKSIPLYQKTLSLSPSDASIRSQLARCYLHAGEYQRGLEVLSPLLASNQGGEWMAMRLYEALGQFDQAIEMGRRLLSILPDLPEGWLCWGQVFLAAGQRDRATATFREGAQKIETQLALVDNVRTRTWLSLLYAGAGDRDKAQEQANRALLAEPNDPWVLFWICNVHSVLGNRSQAVDYLKRAVANGFLAIHYVKEQEKPSGGLYGLRDNREYQAVRDALERKVEELKKKY
jgi:tetratricopeptide (TPR) repeat protein